MRLSIPVLGVAAALTCAAPIHAQLAPPEAPPAPTPTAEPPPPQESDAVNFRLEKPRSRNNKIMLASLFGGGALISGVGLLFHLDSRSKSNDVSAVGELTGLVWTEDREDTRKSALRSRKISIGFYAVGGAVIVGGIIALIATQPGEEIVGLTGVDSLQPTISATEDSAIVGASWSFQ